MPLTSREAASLTLSNVASCPAQQSTAPGHPSSLFHMKNVNNSIVMKRAGGGALKPSDAVRVISVCVVDCGGTAPCALSSHPQTHIQCMTPSQARHSLRLTVSVLGDDISLNGRIFWNQPAEILPPWKYRGSGAHAGHCGRKHRFTSLAYRVREFIMLDTGYCDPC